MPRRSILLFAGFCVMVAAALVFVSFFVVNSRDRASEAGFVETGTGTAQIGGPFQLVDQDGRAVDQSLLDGKWTLVFFGFTYCPDFCPTTLASIEATERLLGDKAADLQTIFITVDPARDTPEALNNYLNSEGFPEGVIGLTGTPEQIDGAAKAYRAIYEKVGEGDAYTMNHSLTVYLMGPDGQFRSAISHDLGPQRSAELIERVMARG